MKSFGLLAVSILGLCILSACGGGASGANGGGGGGPQVATRFSVMAPATASAGTPFSVTVVALDASNQTVASYSGTVHFTSSDPRAVLSANSTLTNGTGIFSESLTTIGGQTITATDTVTTAITGSSNSIDVTTNSNAHGFRATGDMGTERASHTATLLPDGKVLIVGGFNNTEVLATAELFDPVAGTFTPTATMTFARFLHTATLLANGKVLVTGGSDNLGALATHVSRAGTLHANGKVPAGASISSFDLATAELYDPATGTFTVTGAMSEVRSEHTATLLANGKVLVAGGTADNVAELYDPATGLFTPTSGMLVVGGRWACTATLLNDGTVLIAGGRDDEDVFDALPLNDAELFNPTTGTFTATGAMNQFRYDHTATLLESGQVLMAGGFNGNPVPDAELFDPTTGSFSRTGFMSSPRADHTATLLNDGTVLVAGAFSFSAPLASAEVFDPTTSEFAPTGSMETPRYIHTATLLSSGEVLVTGGSPDLLDTALSSAELYK